MFKVDQDTSKIFYVVSRHFYSTTAIYSLQWDIYGGLFVKMG